MKRQYLINCTGQGRPCMAVLPGVNNRQAKRWMKKIYQPGMTVLQLAEAAYQGGAVDSIDQAANLAYDIVMSNR